MYTSAEVQVKKTDAKEEAAMDRLKVSANIAMQAIEENHFHLVLLKSITKETK